MFLLFCLSVTLLVSITGATTNEMNVEIKTHLNYSIDVFAYSEDYVYAGHDRTLSIINISDPINPILEGKYEANDFIRKIEVEKNIAYIVDGDKQFSIINVSNPKNPFVEGKYTSSEYISTFAINENFVYTAEGRYLRIVNVTSNKHPTLRGQYKVVYKIVRGNRTQEIIDEISHIELENDLAYASIQNCMFIINVNDPDNIFLEGKYLTSSHIKNIDVTETIGYLSCWMDGFLVVNLNNPKKISLINNHYIPKSKNSGTISTRNKDFMAIKQVVTEGNFTYVIGDENQFVILNSSNPKNISTEACFSIIERNDFGKATPAFEGYSDRTKLLDFEVEDNLVYLVDRYNGLTILSFNDNLNGANELEIVSENDTRLLNNTEQVEQNSINKTKIDDKLHDKKFEELPLESNNSSKIPGFEITYSCIVIIILYCVRRLF